MALTLNGSTGISGVNGSASAPSVKGSDSNTGVAFASDTVLFSTGGSERARINSNGVLLLNTTTESTTPSQPHFIQVGDGNNFFTVEHNGSVNGSRASLSVGTTALRTVIDLRNTNGSVGTIKTTGTATQFNTSSDYRLKENATAISDGITRLKTLKPYRFNFKTDKTITLDGFFAHEVTAVPEAISGDKDAVITQALIDSGDPPTGNVGDPIYQGIDQSKLVPLLTAALQEAVAKIETLETKVAALEAA